MKREEFVKNLSEEIDLLASVIWDCFDYLERLRQTGATNMFGATPYLMEYEPLLTKEQAKRILSGWMNSYDMED